MSFLKKLDKNFELVCLAILLMIMTVLSFANVVMRYCFKSPIYWSDEVCCFCLALSAFFCLPYSIRWRTAIRVDTFSSMLPKVAQRIRDDLFTVENIIDILETEKHVAHRLQGKIALVSQADDVDLVFPFPETHMSRKKSLRKHSSRLYDP